MLYILFNLTARFRILMDFYTANDNEVLSQLGLRLKSARLRKNKTQQQVADTALLSLRIIKGLEKGRGTLANLVIYLRELNLLHELDHFIPDISISPMQILKQRGKVRQRASRQSQRKSPKEASEW